MNEVFNKKLALLEEWTERGRELASEMQKEAVVININTPAPDTYLNHKDFAKLLDISPDALYIRCNKKHLYDTPEGYTEPAFTQSAKAGAPVFNVRLANLYYEINTKKNNL